MVSRLASASSWFLTMPPSSGIAETVSRPCRYLSVCIVTKVSTSTQPSTTNICSYEYVTSVVFDIRLVTKPDSRPLLVRTVKWVHTFLLLMRPQHGRRAEIIQIYICCRYCNLATCLGVLLIFGSHGISHCSVSAELILEFAKRLR